jgi:hypothetical protein
MAIASRISKTVQNLLGDKEPYVRKTAEIAAFNQQAVAMSKKELQEAAASGDKNIAGAANDELARRMSNAEVKRTMKEKVDAGELTEKQAEARYKRNKADPRDPEGEDDTAVKARMRMAKGGMAKKKPAAKKAPAKTNSRSSRSNLYNKDYGK